MKALRLLTAALVMALTLWAVPCTVLADAYYQLTPTWDGTAGNRLAHETDNYKFDYGDSGAVSFDLPWNFRFYGQNYTRITADTNGNIWLGTVIPSPLPDSFALASTGPVISVWNNDLSSYYDGGVFIERKTTDTDRVVVHWRTETFVDAGYGRTNEFEAVLFADGTIRFDYKTFDSQASGDYGSGISKGSGTEYLSLSSYGEVTTLANSSFRYDPDFTPPDFTIDPIISPTNALSKTLSGTKAAGVQVTVFNTTSAQFSTIDSPEPTSWSADVSLLEGDNTIRVTAASDHSNNSTTVEVAINLDTIGPIVSITSPVAGVTNNKTPQINYSSSEGTPVVKLDEVTVNKLSGSYLDPLTEGPHTLRVEAADALGNPGFAQVSFTVDTVAPSVTVDPVSSPTRNLAQTLTGTMEEEAIITVTANTTATVGPVTYSPTSTTWQCTVEDLALDDNTLTVTARDAAGNPSSVMVHLQYLPFSLNITPTVIAADYQGMVALTIQNLASTGGSVSIEVLLDANQNAQADANEPVIRTFKVTDGVGSANPNVVGDGDGAANGAITTSLNYLLKLDANHAPGDYLIKVAEGLSPTISAALTVTPVVQSQTIQGMITDGLNPVPGALVQIIDKWQRPIGYAAADDQGQYLVDMKVSGDYRLIPLAPGFASSKVAAPLVTLAAGQNLTAVDLTVTAGVYTLTGRVMDQGTSTGIDGVWVVAESSDHLGTSLTDATGTYSLVLPAGDYQVNVDGSTAAAKGYLRTGGNQVNLTGDRSGVDLALPMATVFASGKVSDEFGVGVAGVPIQGMSADALIEAHAVSDTNGNYTLGLSSGNGWTASLAEQMEYVGTRISNLDISSSVTGKDLSAQVVNAWIKGSVKDAEDAPLSGVSVSETTQEGLQQAVATATDGTYLLGAFPGIWQVFADTQASGCNSASDQQKSIAYGETAVADFVNIECSLTVPSITVPVSSATGEYTISWQASPVSGVTYQLEEATSADFSSGLRTVISATTALSAVISGRTVGVTYYYRVRAEKAGLSSVWVASGNGCVVITFTAECRYDGSNYAIDDEGYLGFLWGGIPYWGDVQSDAYGCRYFETGGYRYTFGAIKQDSTWNGGGSWYREYDACVSVAGEEIIIRPGFLTIPATSTTSYMVTWNASLTGDVTYRLEEATSTNFSTGLRTVASGTTSLSAAISGRTVGVTYYYRVRAEKDGLNSSWLNGANGCAVNAPPDEPASISVPASSPTGSYGVSWGASATSGVTYRLEEATNSSFSSGLRLVVSGATGLSFAVSGRTAGVTYYYRVRAEKYGLSSNWVTGANGCFITLPTPPVSISVPAYSTTGSYTVSWGASVISGVTYRLEEATNSSFSSGLRTVVSGTTALSSAITGRTNGVTYYYRVRAEKSGLTSVWRISSGCDVSSSPPAAPVSIAVPTNNSAGGSVSWGASPTAGVTYRLEEATNSGFTSGLRTITSATTALTIAISGRTAGVTYYYRVRAGKYGLNSSWVAGTNGCLIALPTAPASISVPTGSSTGSYTISWGASSTGGVTYLLEEATNSSFTSGLRTVVIGTTALSTPINGRYGGFTYYYRVRTEQGGLTSSWRTGASGCSVQYSGGWQYTSSRYVLYDYLTGSSSFYYDGLKQSTIVFDAYNRAYIETGGYRYTSGQTVMAGGGEEESSIYKINRTAAGVTALTE